MLRTLIKKQFRECFRSYFVNVKNGKSRSKLGMAAMFVMFTVLMLFLCGTFFMMSYGAGEVLFGTGMNWLFYVLMGLLAILLGTFGSVFNTYSTLYLAKDNELLLSMPIPPSKILISRIMLVYGLSLLYSSLVWLPAILYGWIFGSCTAATVAFGILLAFVIALFVTVLTCALGFVVAMVASRLKNKSFLVVILSLVFFGAYYYFSMNLGNLMSQLLSHTDELAEGIRSWAGLLYQMGLAAAGDGSAMLQFTGVVTALFVFCFWVLSRSFTRIVTRTTGTGKKKAKVNFKETAIPQALFSRELRRFTGSPTYMLNTGFGLVFMLVLAGFAVIKQDLIQQVLGFLIFLGPKAEGFLAVIVVSVICIMLGMNTVSTPSVSLEGKTLWLLRSLPIDGRMVLRAKLSLHIRLNLVPALIAFCMLASVVDLDVVPSLLCGVCIVSFIVLTGSFGLMLGILRPNFHWTSEAMPIKQSLNVFLSVLFGFVVPILMCVGGYFAMDIMEANSYLALAAGVLAAAAVILYRWVDTKGAAAFDRL